LTQRSPLPRRACAQLCRQIPWIMKNYHLDEVTTRSALRSKLASHFRRVETDNPQVVDVLLFKGQAEAHELMAHYTQRHHLVRCPTVRPSKRVVVCLPPGGLSDPLRASSCRLLGM
jgi:NADH dehydrogenase (ubiquinone) 1 alpha subcomplex subunit 6